MPIKTKKRANQSHRKRSRSWTGVVHGMHYREDNLDQKRRCGEHEHIGDNGDGAHGFGGRFCAAQLLVKIIFAVVHTVDDTTCPRARALPVRLVCSLRLYRHPRGPHPHPRLCHPISGYRTGAARAASAQLASARLTP